MGEFELIRRFFERPGPRASGVALGIGDDCALLAPAPGMELAVSSDMLVEGRHFLPSVAPDALGHKALAVNLSDLAAMGANPLGFTLALALPEADETWLEGFARGLFALADAHACALVGGDTTRGPRNLCLTVLGQVPAGQALRRNGARAGDDLYVSGRLGDARLALEAHRGAVRLDPAALARAQARMDRPTPRLALGRALRGVARAAIDLSDGLLGDLGHLLTASGVKAALQVDALLDSRAVSDDVRAQPRALALTCVLAGGDDYELAFTAPPEARALVQHAAEVSDTPVTRIGAVLAFHAPGPRLQLLDARGQALDVHALPLAGFDHFA